MHFLKTLLLSPVMGAAIVVRVSPYLIVFAFGYLWLSRLTLSPEALDALSRFDGFISRRGEAADGELVFWVLKFAAAFLFSLLLVARINREAAKQAGLFRGRERVWGYLLPPLRSRLQVNGMLLLAALVVLWFAYAQRRETEVGFIFSLALVILWLRFPLFGARAVARDAGAPVPPLGTGWATLLVLAPLWLVLATLVVWWSLRLTMIAAEPTIYRGIVLVFALAMMSAASALALKRKLEKMSAKHPVEVRREGGAPMTHSDLLRARMQR